MGTRCAKEGGVWKNGDPAMRYQRVGDESQHANAHGQRKLLLEETRPEGSYKEVGPSGHV